MFFGFRQYFFACGCLQNNADRLAALKKVLQKKNAQNGKLPFERLKEAGANVSVRNEIHFEAKTKHNEPFLFCIFSRIKDGKRLKTDFPKKNMHL